MAAVSCVDDVLGYVTLDSTGEQTATELTANGLRLRNLIHGADTVMSHITHLYHLSALDFINTSNLGHPWAPSFTASDMLSGTDGGAGETLVNNYVTALDIRAKAHKMGAIFSGRHPIQNAIVPGGVTTMLSTTQGETDPTKPGPYRAAVAISKFSELLDEIRNFINTIYIPDVLTVAKVYGSGTGTPPTAVVNSLKDYWSYGTGCGNLLAYGDFILDTSASPTRLIQRGRVHLGNILNDGALTNAYETLDQERIVEYVGYSHYKDYYGGPGATAYKHPWDGETNPVFEKVNSIGTSYSWMKAPRYLAVASEAVRNYADSNNLYSEDDPIVYEVGPLARMVVSYGVEALLGGTPTVSQSATPGSGVTVNSLAGFATSPYNVKQLVDAALFLATGDAGPAITTVALLWSVLGRHAARALEAKFIADAMSGWLNDLANNLSGPVYTYKKIPKSLKKGVGLVEAPRGALGHWIKLEKKKILKYQCVVPSTWNCSPRDDTGQRGAAEECVNSAANIISSQGSPPDLTTDQGKQDAVVNIIRLLHPYDFCAACAIHVVTPDGKSIAKINMDTDGKVTMIE